MTDHPIPDDALDADIATLAQKGAGKTYLNKGLVERLLDLKRRIVVMDPLSIWWGLKALSDGSPGYPVVVIGGPQADVPLDPKKGTELGAYVAKSDVQMVIDVSDLRSGELVSFSTAFLAELYRLNRDPLWLVLEEGDVFAPQNPQGMESFMLHEVDMIARRGRQRGFRLWTICQRPQEINKKTLSQAATMVVMRLMSPQDREAAKKWILSHGTKEQADEILTHLASLDVGEGYVLAPTLGLLERAKFPLIKTLDNSATPKAGEKRVGVKALAKVDVGALRSALASPEPEVPPKILPAAVATEIKAAEQRGFERGQRTQPERLVSTKEQHDAVQLAYRNGQLFTLGAIRKHTRDLEEALPPEPTVFISSTSSEAAKMDTPPAAKHLAAEQRPPKTTTAAAPQTKGAMGLVASAAQVHPVRLTWGQVATLAGRKPSGGHFNSSRKTALDSGWLTDAGGLVSVTTEGLEAAGVTPVDGDPADIFASALPQPANKMFALLRETGALSKDGLAERLSMQPRGGHWNNGLATLRRNGLIREDGDRIHLVDLRANP